MTPPSPSPSRPAFPPGWPMEALQAIRTGGAQALARLNELWDQAPFDLGVRDRQGQSLLHLAMDSLPLQRPSSLAPGTVYPMVAWLLAHGAPLDAVNQHGESVLDMAENRLADFPGTLTAVRTAVQRHRVAHEREALSGAMGALSDSSDAPSSLPRPRL